MWGVQRHHEVVHSDRVRTRNLGAGRSPSLPLGHDVPDIFLQSCIVILMKVHFILSADDIYNVWVNKANEMLQEA